MYTGKLDFTMMGLDLEGVGVFVRGKGLLERVLRGTGDGKSIRVPIFGGFRAGNHLVSEKLLFSSLERLNWF